MNILVFGPTPVAAKDVGRMGDIARKRIEIRDFLVDEGHNAFFPEDEIPKNSSDPLTEEIFLIDDADLVVMIVESIGTNIETGILSGKSSRAEKTFAFIDKIYKGGLSFEACKLIKKLRGSMSTFDYPRDITDCHLKTKILKIVEETQYRKLFP